MFVHKVISTTCICLSKLTLHVGLQFKLMGLVLGCECLTEGVT